MLSSGFDDTLSGSLRNVVDAVLDYLAIKLGYERPRGQVWPEVLMLLPAAVFSMTMLAFVMDRVTGGGLFRALSQFVARWPIITTIGLSAIVVSFFSVVLFAIVHGLQIGRKSTAFLGALLLLTPFVIYFLMFR
ncbi:MAG TPA: hypothetical protein VII69_07070 [Candidatus Eremiobacteraceae bacterium]